MPLSTMANVAGAVGVGMGVLVGGPAVSGPAGVGDAHGAAVAEIGQHGLEVVQVADGVEQLEAALVDDRDAGRVVTAVLELAQTPEEDVPAFPVADVSDDPTHQKETSVLIGPASFTSTYGEVQAATSAS